MFFLLSALPVVALYLLFLRWCGGKGKPMTPAESADLLRALGTRSHDAQSRAALNAIAALAAKDDGREFVMQNLVRYRAKALYPDGHAFGDDPRAADRRHGRAIIWPLLRHGSMILFVARRSGSFLEPADADPWHYVALVRYRSLRDFLRFALEIKRDDIVLHKWAAIEKTHVSPVKPIVRLFFVRCVVAASLAGVGIVVVAAVTIVRAV